MNNFVAYYIVEFFFYSITGWCIESTYCSIGEKRLINRGFLTGPLCPIYGTGALVMTVLLYNPFRGQPFYTFLLGMLLCDGVEYLTSLMMETLFHARWWDYTYEFMNLHGRICLKHTIFWGIGAVGFVEVIHPHVDVLLRSVPDNILVYISIALLAILALDVSNAVRKALDIRKLQDKLRSLTETVSGGLSSIKNTIGDTYESLQLTFVEGNEKLNDKRNEVLEQIQDTLSQFELRFSVRNKEGKKNKQFSRFFRNNIPFEAYTKKQIDRLKKMAEDIKANLFENGEMQ